MSLRARIGCLIAGHTWMPQMTEWYIKGFGATSVVLRYECLSCGARKKRV